MTCADVRHALAAMPDGDLADAHALHLDACPACRGAFDAAFAPAALTPVTPDAPTGWRWGALAATLAAAAGLAFALGGPAEAPPAEPSLLGEAPFLIGSGGLDTSDVVVFVFWEAWCPHCGEGLEAAEAAAQALGDVDVIGVTGLTRGVSEGEARDFAMDHGVTFPVVLDTDFVLKGRYGVTSWPKAVVVDRGRVVWEGVPSRLDVDAVLRRR